MVETKRRTQPPPPPDEVREKWPILAAWGWYTQTSQNENVMNQIHRGILPEATGKLLGSKKFPNESHDEEEETSPIRFFQAIDEETDLTWHTATEEDFSKLRKRTCLNKKDIKSELPIRAAVLIILGTRAMRIKYRNAIENWAEKNLTDTGISPTPQPKVNDPKHKVNT